MTEQVYLLHIPQSSPFSNEKCGGRPSGKMENVKGQEVCVLVYLFCIVIPPTER